MSWHFRPIPAAAAQQQAGGGAAYSLAASAGALSLGGQTVLALATRRVQLAGGAAALGGQAAGLHCGRGVSVDGAAFATVGQSVTFPRTLLLSAGVGAFAVDGQAAGFASSAIKLTALNGGFAILGPDARLAVLRKLAALKRSIEVTGRAAAIPGETASAGARASAELGLSVGF
jgi:hypothetical protein